MDTLYATIRLMKKTVKVTISPCRAKGRYGGKQGGANRFYQNGSNITAPSGCECGEPWVMFGAKIDEPKKSCFFLNLSNLSLTKKSTPKNKEILPVVPCNETFLLPTSSGTRKYKKATKSKFQGCYPLEESLLENQEVRHEPFDNLSADLETNPADDFTEFPMTDKLLISKSDIEGYRLEAYEEYHKQHEVSWARKSQSTSLSFWEVAQTLQEERNRLEDYLYLLTPKQKEAVKSFYLENEKRLSLPQVAKKLKVSAHSLKDRLDNSLKRIHQCAPHFRFPELRKSSERAKYWKPQDSEFDGLYRKSHSKAQPIRILNPTSLEVVREVAPQEFKKLGWGTKEKQKINKKAIKQWALEMTPLPRYN